MTVDEFNKRIEGKNIHVQVAHPYFIVWVMITQAEALALRKKLAGHVKVRDVNYNDVLLEIVDKD